MKYMSPISLFRELKPRGRKGEGRLLGLDVGDKYIGLAVSDRLCRIASPLSVLHREKSHVNSVASDLQNLVSDLSLEGFVVGYPFDRQMESASAVHVKVFIDDLCRTRKLEGLRYTYWNESFSSKNMELLIEPFNFPPVVYKTIIDKFAAVSILQDYLDNVNKMTKSQTSNSSE